MEPRAKSSNAGEVPKPREYTPPPPLKMNMTKLADGTCRYVRVISTTTSAKRTPAVRTLATKQLGRPRKYGLVKADSMSASPMVTSHDVETLVTVMGSGDYRFVTPLVGINASAPVEPRVKISNAGEVPKPQAYAPPPRLEMSMTKMPDGSCHYRVVPTAISTGGKDRVQPVKVPETKKQGRPRKYRRFTTASTAENPAVPSPEVVPLAAGMGGGDDESVDGNDLVATLLPSAAISALGSRQNDIMPYIVNIKAGQDISSTLSSFCQKGHIRVLSANGVVSQVALHQATTSGGPITYEGRFEILLLTGLLSETGGLRVLLAGPNCQVFGGRLAGKLIAALPVQVMVVWTEEPLWVPVAAEANDYINRRNQQDLPNIPRTYKKSERESQMQPENTKICKYI